jgi:hypothetical protein
MDTFHVTIPPGWDPYVTRDTTWFDFASDPIPADFFGPGSDPFDGRVYCTGVPLDTVLCPDGWDFADVVIERQQPLEFPSMGAHDAIPIEIVALSLRSVEPITVTYFNGTNPELWDVKVTLAPGQTPGTLDATLTHLDGGEFDMAFPVRPKFEFEQAEPPFGSAGSFIPPSPSLMGMGVGVSPFSRIVPPGWNCEDCGSHDFIPGCDGTDEYTMELLDASFRHTVETACQTGLPPGPADDLTTALGAFTLWVYPAYRPLLDGCDGWDGHARLNSGVLFDPGTIIGRSDVHLDGDGTDSGGALVGTAGWVVSDGDLTLRPPGWEGPPGTRELHTALGLQLGDPAAPMRLRTGDAAPTRPISPGEIEAGITPGIDFPAESFFDVYFELDLDSCGAGFNDAIVYNTEPLLLMNGHVEGHPLEGLWVHGNGAVIEVRFATDDPGGMWTTGDLLGYLVKCGVGISFDETPLSVALFDSLMAGLPEIPVVITAVEDMPRPQTNYLDVNYPNPFNPVTTIQYGLKEPAEVKLEIYNVAGQLVRTLVDEFQTPRAGGFTVRWDGTNDRGDGVASGVYFYRLRAGTFSQTRKMALLR